ncbi:MAG: molybdate ABC transporter substrate-binding protein [Ilumatobacteraceae bacterium]
MKRFGLAFSCLLLTVGCTQSDIQTITVFAASSLQDAFEQLEIEFEVAHSGYEVQFSFNSSTQLSHQIIDGAPADVFASADTDNMDLLVLQGEVAGTSTVFTTNHLQILVARSAVDRIHSLVDLSRPDVVLVLAATDVPLGRYSASVLSGAGVTVSPVSYEPSASGVVSKVVNGEADAGIVYSSDVVRAGSTAVGVDIPLAINSDVFYPIAVTRHGAQQPGAAQWVKFVLSERGQEVLRQYGFSSIGDR